MASAPDSERGPINVTDFESSVYGNAKDPDRRAMQKRFQGARGESAERLEAFRNDQQGLNQERVRSGNFGPDFAVSEMFASAAIGHLMEQESLRYRRQGDRESAANAKKISNRAFKGAEAWGRVHDGNPTPEDAEVVRDTVERYQSYIDHEVPTDDGVPKPARPADQPDPYERAGHRPEDREDPRVRESRERIDRARRARERGRADRGYRSR